MGRRRGGQEFQERRAKARALEKPGCTGPHNKPVYKRLMQAAVEQLLVNSVLIKSKIKVVSTETSKGTITVFEKITEASVNKPTGVATRFLSESSLVTAVRDWDTASDVSTLINSEVATYQPTPIPRTSIPQREVCRITQRQPVITGTRHIYRNLTRRR